MWHCCISMSVSCWHNELHADTHGLGASLVVGTRVVDSGPRVVLPGTRVVMAGAIVVLGMCVVVLVVPRGILVVLGAGLGL
jgi:hypothetical protein